MLFIQFPVGGGGLDHTSPRLNLIRMHPPPPMGEQVVWPQVVKMSCLDSIGLWACENIPVCFCKIFSHVEWRVFIDYWGWRVQSALMPRVISLGRLSHLAQNARMVSRMWIGNRVGVGLTRSAITPCSHLYSQLREQVNFLRDNVSESIVARTEQHHLFL